MLLMLVLQPLLFKPWLEVQSRRAQRIDGAFAEAERMEAEAATTEADYAKKMAEARAGALGARSKDRHVKEAEAATLLDAARSDASKSLASETARLDKEAAAARSALEIRIDDLAESVAQKVLGRTA